MARYLKPFEMEFLEEVGRQTDQVILHVCKPDPRLEPSTDYPAQAVNWAVHESSTSLIAGRKLFGRTIMGGLDDRSGVLVDGSANQIQEVVQRIFTEYGRNSLILGTDCTLPTDISPARIRQAVDAARL